MLLEDVLEGTLSVGPRAAEARGWPGKGAGSSLSVWEAGGLIGCHHLLVTWEVAGGPSVGKERGGLPGTPCPAPMGRRHVAR